MDVREIPNEKRLATLKFLTACRTAVLAQMQDLATAERHAERNPILQKKVGALRDDTSNHLDELNSHIARFSSAKANCTDAIAARKTFSKFDNDLYFRISGLRDMYDLGALPKELATSACASINNAESEWKSAGRFSATRELPREPVRRTPQGKRR